MSIEKAAKDLIRGGKVDDGLLNRVEMAFRPYDPCFGCATHFQDGKPFLTIVLKDARGNLIRRI
jgi:F420-non-reducing hydrogenase large subunit